jgi:hypothetical protein
MVSNMILDHYRKPNLKLDYLLCSSKSLAKSERYDAALSNATT